MLNEEFLNLIIGQLEKTGGVSADISAHRLLPPQDYWMFPKYPSKTLVLPHNIDLKKSVTEYVDLNKKWLLEPGCLLGIWLNPQSKQYYFDITTTEKNKDDAVRKAKLISRIEGRKIVAIFNPVSKITVFL